MECANLVSVNLNMCTMLEEYSFCGCSKLHSLWAPFATIDIGVFKNCSSL